MGGTLNHNPNHEIFKKYQQLACKEGRPQFFCGTKMLLSDAASEFAKSSAFTCTLGVNLAARPLRAEAASVLSCRIKPIANLLRIAD